MSLTPVNRQEEWYQEMINAQTGKYLPTISSADAGKVMTVSSNGDWEVDDIPSPIPAVAQTDKDKYLHTNQTTGALERSAVQGGSGTSILPVETETDLYTETLGEVVEFQVTFMGTTVTHSGIEAVGMTADIEQTISADVNYPSPMLYTYRVGDVIYDNSSDADWFVPVLADDGKYYFGSDAGQNSPFDGASGEVVAIYKTALQFPPNVLCLYDPTDPKGDESYLPEYVEYDDGYWVSADYDASAFYDALTHGNAAYAVIYNGESNNGYEYMIAGAFHPETDGDESYLSVSLWNANAYIYNWTGVVDSNEDEPNAQTDDEQSGADVGIVIDPIGGGDHEIPAPDNGEAM